MSNLVLFDLDDTLLKGQSQKLFLKLMREYGFISGRKYMQLTVWFIMYKLSLVRNTEKVRAMAYEILEGCSVNELTELLWVNRHIFFDRLISDAVSVLKWHQRSGDHVVLISASNNFIVKLISDHLEVSLYLATELEQRNDNLTGKIIGKGLYGSEKLRRLDQFLPKISRDYDEVMLYTDHHSDFPLLQSVDHPRCVNPNKKLENIAIEKGWQVLNWK